MSEVTRKIWLVEHPTHVYVEDVKALARKADLVIVDPAVASDEDRAEAIDPAKAPKLTVRGEGRASK